MRKNLQNSTSMSAVAAAMVLASCGAALAGDAALTPRVERVALFKNGLGYFTSVATLPANAQTVTLAHMPIPVLGTFWVTPSSNVRLRGLFTSLVDFAEQVPAGDLAGLLSANVGRKVRVNGGTTDGPLIEGVVVSAGGERSPQEPDSPYLMGMRRGEGAGVRSAAAFVAIKTERGLVVLNAAAVSRVEFEGGGIATTVRDVQQRPTMRVELEKPAPGERLSLSYLAHGITWSPSYLIDLTDPKTARLTASAVVVNEVADLENVRLDLVTGYPNMLFADVRSPIAMSQSLADFLSALGQGTGEWRNGRGSVVSQLGLANSASFETISVAAPSSGLGQTAEDLFLYPIEQVNLRRGETVHLPLFSADMPYEHLYTWSIADFLDERDRYRQGDQPRTEEVWHSCRLTNAAKMPLTTAPAQFVTNGQFTGQDVCRFTAPGAETTIHINRAMHLVADQAEVEVERKREASRFHGSSYDLVKIRGELRLRSRLDKTATVEVTKQLSGDVSETVPTAKDVATTKGLRQVNTRHTLVWKIDVQPGEERKLTYTYDVYIND